MTRLVRSVVSALSIALGLATLPSVAQAQVNVAPPAYPERGWAPPPAPPLYGVPGPELDRRAEAYRGRDDSRYGSPWYRPQGGWERAPSGHLRQCIRAYESGAPRWVLWRMHCEPY
jgi:hypothetical protein